MILYYVVLCLLCFISSTLDQTSLATETLNQGNFLSAASQKAQSNPSPPANSISINGEVNAFILNTEVGEMKSASSPSDDEQEIFPTYASATSYCEKKNSQNFINGSRAPENVISGHNGFWNSQENTKEDALIMTFEIPTKIDIMNILWRIPPTSFVVEFNLEENSTFVPLINKEIKYQPINENGERVSISKVSNENTLYFKKPVYAKNIRIKMWDPLKNNMFSIEKVRYYNVKSLIIIVNQTANPCLNYCLYVNSDKPHVNSLVEAVSCLSGMTTADNREIFELSFDRSIRTLTGHLCLGFNTSSKYVQLFECQSPVQWVMLYNQDGSMSFKGYENMCMFIDKSNSFSDNFITAEDNIEVSSTFLADSETYKKGNILENSENYWMSNPGQKKASMTLNFGKRSSNEWEIKKIDKIIINWAFEPIEFRIFSWFPESSWTLIKIITNNKQKTTEVLVNSIKSSSILIEMDKGNSYEDKNNQVVYGIKDVMIFSASYKLKMDLCENRKIDVKLFNIESQYDTKLSKSEEFTKEQSKLRKAYEAVMLMHKSLINSRTEMEQAKSNAIELKNKFKKISEQINLISQVSLKTFVTDKLAKTDNPQFGEYLVKLEKLKTTSKDLESNKLTDLNFEFKTELSFSSFLATSQKSQYDQLPYSKVSSYEELGTNELRPGKDCLYLKHISTEIKSGFYWIKPNCAPNALKVWCDFSIGVTAVDIYLYFGEGGSPSQNLLDSKLFSAKNIQIECAKKGLYPLEISGELMIKRISQLAKYEGINLSSSKLIPIGYDYSCETSDGCSLGLYNSLNRAGSAPVFSVNNSEIQRNNPAMVGIGNSSEDKLITFNPQNTSVAGIVCSTNRFEIRGNAIPYFDCDVSLNNTGTQFNINTESVIECSAACNQSKSEVYGGPLYDGKSSICKAAIHSGIISHNGGVLKILVLGPNLASRTSGESNGIKSIINPRNDGSLAFSFKNYLPDCPIDQFPNLKNGISFLEYSEIITNKCADCKDTSKPDSPTENKSNPIENLEHHLNKIKIGLSNIAKSGSSEGEYDTIKTDLESIIARLESKSNSHSTSGNSKILIEEKIGQPSKVALLEKNSAEVISNSDNGESCKLNKKDDAKIKSIDATKVAMPDMKYLKEKVKGISNNFETKMNEDLSHSQNFVTGSTSNRILNLDSLKNIDMSLKTYKEEEFIRSSIRAYPEIMKDSIEEPIQYPAPYEQCTPTTESGIFFINEHFQSNIQAKLDSLTDQLKKIQLKNSQFEKDISWANGNDYTSNSYLRMIYKQIKTNIGRLSLDINKVKSLAFSRKEKIESICSKWRAKLGNLNRFNKFNSKENGSLQQMYETFNAKSESSSNKNGVIKFASLKAGRIRVVSISNSPKPKIGLAGSINLVKGKDSFDFTFEIDLMTASSIGNFGILFRFKDRFNYYAVDIDMTEKRKTLSKVINGKITILDSREDGAIIPNSWHKVTVQTQSSDFKVEIIDLESCASKKYFSATDSSISRGGIGFYASGAEEAVHFDNIRFKSNSCWSPWKPRRDLKIIPDKANNFKEDFKGSLENAYKFIDSPFSTNGPSEYSFVSSSSISLSSTMRMSEEKSFEITQWGIKQKSLVCDNTVSKKPSLLINYKIFLEEGKYRVQFVSDNTNGSVSIIFKFSRMLEDNDCFYSFDLNSYENEEENDYTLRKFSNNYFETLKAVKSLPSNAPSFMKKGYVPNIPMLVIVSLKGQQIEIYISYNNAEAIKIIEIEDINPLKKGRIGLGTNCNTVLFSEISTSPHEIFVPRSQADQVILLNEKSTSGQSTSFLVGSRSRTEVVSNSVQQSRITFSMSCSAISAIAEREHYCVKKHTVNSKYCSNNFCEVCCEDISSDNPSKHICMKTCKTVVIPDTSIQSFNNCFKSPTINFCNLKGRTSSEVDTLTCKRDFCVLCCNVKPIIVGKKNNLELASQCIDICSEKFKTKSRIQS